MTDPAAVNNSKQLLLQRCAPAVRSLLIRERIRAMEGGIDGAVRSLMEAAALVCTDRPHDAVALGLLAAELLHNDHQHNKALALLEKVVVPNLTSLTEAEKFSVEQNLSDVQLYSPLPSHELFYNVVDRKRVLNFEWLDYHDLFSAMQEADRGKHFETLPILWRQHRRAYLHGCWLAQRWTNHLLAKECVRLCEWEDAVNHAVHACDDELTRDIADGILSSRRAGLVGRVIRRLITTANLRAHFVVACKLITYLEDAIPDTLVANVGEWLLKRAKETRTTLIGPNHVSAAWETIGSIAWRFPRVLSLAAVDAAVTHPVWVTRLDDPNRVIPERREVVRALVPLCWTLNQDDIPSLARATLPLATDRKQFSDYDDVVNLLAHLANRGGESVRDSLGPALFPSGQPISRVLAQVAEIFGQSHVLDSLSLQKLAHQVAQEIRRQVQWLEPGQVAEPVAEQIMEFSRSKIDRTLKVYVAGLGGLHILARNRKKLDESAIRAIVEAILDLAHNKDNFCSNRAALLHVLIEFADVVSDKLRFIIHQQLEPLARGLVEESTEYPTAEKTDDPLNAFKHQSGRPEDVQELALVAYAAFVSAGSSAKRVIGEILEDALCDHRPGIRRAAYKASRRLADVSEGIILSVLAGLRDPDANATIFAFAAFAKQTTWNLNANHWRLLLMATRFAQRTGTPNVRRHAAAALSTWSDKCPVELTPTATELLTKFRNDICASVRNAVGNSHGDDTYSVL